MANRLFSDDKPLEHRVIDLGFLFWWKKNQEEKERRERDSKRPRLELPVYKDGEPKEEDKPEEKQHRGIIIIDYNQDE